MFEGCVRLVTSGVAVERVNPPWYTGHCGVLYGNVFINEVYYTRYEGIFLANLPTTPDSDSTTTGTRSPPSSPSALRNSTREDGETEDDPVYTEEHLFILKH